MVFTLCGVWLPTVLSVKVSNGSKLYATRRNAHANLVCKNHSRSWKIFAGKASDSLFQSSTTTASDKIRMETQSGIKDTIPAWIKFSVQAPREIPYNGIYYSPQKEKPVINTYANLRDEVIHRIKRLGYNAVQIMGIKSTHIMPALVTTSQISLHQAAVLAPQRI